MRRLSLALLTLLLAPLVLAAGAESSAATTPDGAVERGSNIYGEGYALLSLPSLSDVASATVTMAAGTDYIALFAADARATAPPPPFEIAPFERTSPWRGGVTRMYLEGGIATPAVTFALSPISRTRFLLILARHFDRTGAPAPTSVTVHGTVAEGNPSLSESFASPAFASQWAAGEAITPNFWGPLSTARGGEQEPYVDAPGGHRLVQYFDKGRMELTNGTVTNGTVTNGLLGTELITGQLQLGDATFARHSPAYIPIAGDPDNAGPTYAALGMRGITLLAPAPARPGLGVNLTVSTSGEVAVGDLGAGSPALVSYDDVTHHNVPQPFATFRDKAGILTIGLAICEPFMATVKVAGQQQQVMIQVFERRVLTYTASNPDPFKVEMGNIGQHYYLWRNGPGAAALSIGSLSLSPVIS